METVPEEPTLGEPAPEVAPAVAQRPATSHSDDIKPYKIHVSSRYLDLTKQKLELTRLPHESSEPKSLDWWEPKPQIEPLIDFWLEHYSWRHQEESLNASLQQFRTAITIPSSEAPIRIHFIHVHSPHSNAIALLLIPPFPFSNLSFGHLVKPFTDPEDVDNNQPFHLVIPALPGLGFSDALPNNTSVISTTAELLDTLMRRLSYPHYLVSNAGSASSSPGEIDWKLASHLSKHYPDACLGTHFISPPLGQPKLQEAPLEWAKWSIASFFHAPILGYQREDFSALERTGVSRFSKKPQLTPTQIGLNNLGLTEPNTLAYALCDSPTGLLVFVLRALRLLSPKKEFHPTEVIDFTQLAWLPGPEAAMRFWAHCAQHPEEEPKTVPTSKPKVAITVFLGDEEGTTGAGSDQVESVDEHRTAAEQGLPATSGVDPYVCPTWANAKHRVVYTHRATGKAGLLAWERPAIITTGVRGLAKETLRLDARLRPAAEQPTVPLEQVIAAELSAADAAPPRLDVLVAAPEQETSGSTLAVPGSRGGSDIKGKGRLDEGKRPGSADEFGEASPGETVVDQEPLASTGSVSPQPTLKSS